MPTFKLEAIARMLLPDILEAWKDDTLQKEFTEWLCQWKTEGSIKVKKISLKSIA